MKTNMTTLCYIEQDGQYLMLLRNKKENDLNEGKWIGIGGHFESMESPEDCIKREVFEETGLTLQNCSFRGIVTFCDETGYTEYMHLFTSSQFTGTIKECSEGTLQWIPKSKIEHLSLWEGDRVFLRLLETEHLFFSLKLVYEGSSLKQVFLNGTQMS